MKKISITVDNCLRMDASELDDDTIEEIQDSFTHVNPQRAFLRAIKKPIWGVPKDYKMWALSHGELRVPRGGIQKIREILKERDYSWEMKDERIEGGYCPDFPEYIGHSLRYYQEAAVQAGIFRENCILRSPTGSGKTEFALALLARIGLNALVILPSTGLFKQWIERAKQALGIEFENLGIIQGKTRRLRPLTLAMQATLARGVHEDVSSFFGVVLIDEVQRAAADSMVRIINEFPARYRIGVSASEKRKDKKEFLTYGLFGSIAYEITRDELTAQGHIVDVEIRVIPTEFEAPWYGKDDGRDIDFTRLTEEMTTDEKRNELAVKFILDELRQGEQAIVLSHRREHVFALDRAFLQNRFKTGYMLGEQHKGDRDEFDRTSAGLRDGTVRVGVGTYAALGYGIDLPAVSVGMATTPIGNNKQNFNQVRGRLCRVAPGKKRGRLYLLMDFNVYGLTHLKNVVAWNSTVVVWHNDQWIPARQYLRLKAKNYAKPLRSIEEPLFR